MMNRTPKNPDPAASAPPRTPAPPSGPAPLPPAHTRDASLTGSEPMTSRNQMTSEPGEQQYVADGTAPPATAAPAPEKPRQPGKDAQGKDLPVLPTYPDTGNGTQEICLEGGGAGGGAQYCIGKPLPIDLTIGSDIYNLSDRGKGIYTFRVK